MPLTANRELSRYVDQELRSYKVAASVHVFKGGFVGLDRVSGLARPLVAGDAFIGVAYEEVDNSSGAAAAQSVRVYTEGDFLATLSGATTVAIGRPAYVTADDTLSLGIGSAAAYLGRIVDVPAVNKIILRIETLADAQMLREASVPLLSLTSGATHNPLLITHKPLLVHSVDVIFSIKPDVGLLNLGFDNADPDELVDAFNLATLTNNVRATPTLLGNAVPKDTRIWAQVTQATSTAGVGGLLTMRYVEFP